MSKATAQEDHHPGQRAGGLPSVAGRNGEDFGETPRLPPKLDDDERPDERNLG
jgi:hypothetical protein